MRDWRVWAKTIGRQAPATINNTLAAIDDFYVRRGLGTAAARREALPRRAPKALSSREVVRYLRAVEHCDSTRDTVTALLPFYAGLRIGEVVGLDLDDVALSARKVLSAEMLTVVGGDSVSDRADLMSVLGRRSSLTARADQEARQARLGDGGPAGQGTTRRSAK